MSREATAAAVREAPVPPRPVAPREAPATAPRPAVSKMYRVLIVDDHSVVRRGIRSLLESQPGVEVCGEAATGAEALHKVNTDHPDLIVLDLTMPEKNGLEVTRVARQQSPQTDVLILTMHFSEEIAKEVLRCGARGYLLKSDADHELLTAVRHIQQHKPFFTSKLAMSMAESFVRDPGTRETGAAEVPLSARELEVVQLLASGKSNKEAAAMIGVSTRTVESHRNHIMRKMEFQSFSDLIRFAIRANLIQP